MLNSLQTTIPSSKPEKSRELLFKSRRMPYKTFFGRHHTCMRLHTRMRWRHPEVLASCSLSAKMCEMGTHRRTTDLILALKESAWLVKKWTLHRIKQFDHRVSTTCMRLHSFIQVLEQTNQLIIVVLKVLNTLTYDQAKSLYTNNQYVFRLKSAKLHLR